MSTVFSQTKSNNIQKKPNFRRFPLSHSEVTEDGGYLLGNIKADATWEECTRIDWNEVAKFDDEEGKLSPYSVERTGKEHGWVWECCQKRIGPPTCLLVSPFDCPDVTTSQGLAFN